MPEPGGTPIRRVETIGGLAQEALVESARGRVAATFPSSAYLELGPLWICVGPAALGVGPLNVLAPVTAKDLGDLSVGDAAALDGKILRIGHRLRLSLADAATWHPRGGPTWSMDKLGQGLSRLDRKIAAGRLAVASPLLGADPSACGLEDFVAETAGQAMTGLEVWLSEAWQAARPLNQREAELAAGLVGLGPGLTPAGDDFLGGMLIALVRLGRADLASHLEAVVLFQVPERSHPISGAHLQAAAKGQGSAALMASLDALLADRSESLSENVATLGRIGHSSGWDALAGVLLVLRCCHAAFKAASQRDALSAT